MKKQRANFDKTRLDASMIYSQIQMDLLQTYFDTQTNKNNKSFPGMRRVQQLPVSRFAFRKPGRFVEPLLLPPFS